jgi:glyoxylase-like metal-dependent hydrolase (beta-lactamase superfamily II)
MKLHFAAHIACTFLVLLLAAAGARAQPGGAAQPVEATSLSAQLYFLPGGSGANSTALVGEDGILLVDAKTDAASAEGIVASLAEIVDGPVAYLINTHEHPDHTGGNEFFGERGAIVFAPQGVRDVLAAGQRGGPPSPDIALPTVTIGTAESMTLYFNGETIEIIDMPPAHTASNAMVHFVNADVYHLGDLYTRTRYPVVAGGTVQGFIDAADQVLAMSGTASKFIPGIGEVGDRADLLRYRNMLVTVRDRVAALVEQGKSADEILAENPTAEFDATYGDPSRLFLPPLIQELGGD